MRTLRFAGMVGFAGTVALATLSMPATAQARGSATVSTAWLAGHLNDPNLIILHVGDGPGYARHIAGGRYVSLQDISIASAPSGLALELPPAEDLRRRLGALGISDTSRIVVYYGQDWVTSATRVVFTLDAAGFGSRTALLDGGMAAWQREGRPLTSVIPARSRGRLSALHMQPRVVDATFVRNHQAKAGWAVIDARAASYFDGVQADGMRNGSKAKGHIPNARSIPFSAVIDTQLLMQPDAVLAATFARAGVKRGDKVVVYCHIGEQATAIVLAARRLGYEAFLYDGSFEDWSRRKLPVTTSAFRP